jgi:hypothetical protein
MKNKQQTSISQLEKAGYKGTKVMSMIKAIESQEIFKHLRLVQQDEFARVKNRYNKNGYLTTPYFSYLWNLYWNFVLNDFRYESSKSWTEVTKVKIIEPQHIGMKILKDLKNEKCQCNQIKNGGNIGNSCHPSNCSLNH